MKRLLAAGAILAASLTGGASAASAQAPLYPPGPPSIVIIISPTIIITGFNVNITFIGCFIGEWVTFSFGSSTGSTICSAGGGGAARGLTAPSSGGSATLTMPAPETAGTYEVSATGSTSGASATAMEEVTDKAPASATFTVPSDSDFGRPLLIGGSAALAGLGLSGVAFQRRRRAAAA